MTTSSYVLRGLDANGVESFYTGRAGAAWVSADVAGAFGYDTLAGARRKAALFNARVALTGIWFTAKFAGNVPVAEELYTDGGYPGV